MGRAEYNIFSSGQFGGDFLIPILQVFQIALIVECDFVALIFKIVCHSARNSLEPADDLVVFTAQLNKVIVINGFRFSSIFVNHTPGGKVFPQCI